MIVVVALLAVAAVLAAGVTAWRIHNHLVAVGVAGGISWLVSLW